MAAFRCAIRDAGRWLGRSALVVALLTLPDLSARALADELAAARFRGTGRADPIRVTNARARSGSVAGQGTIAFDLAWDHSWRAAWRVDDEQHGGSGPLQLENWDAAWVFAKVRLPGADGWSHAVLSPNRADHRLPGGATLDVGLTDDGSRAVGVFVYRDLAGHGPNDFPGVAVRWLSGSVDPAAVDVRVFAVGMVYVPQCGFWVGDGATNDVAAQFSAGIGVDPCRVESERALILGGDTPDAINNREAAGVNPAWTDDFSSDVPRALPAEFPKGFRAFYCMRHEITQQQYGDFLNTLSYAEQSRRSRVQVNAPPGTVGVRPTHDMGRIGRNGITIAISGTPGVVDPLVIQRGSFVASASRVMPAAPAVYAMEAPHVACNFLSPADGAAFATWAGLRPMTECEFEKACRGPLTPVPNEFAWGTAQIAGADPNPGAYRLENAGGPDEAVVWEGDGGPDATRGNAAFGSIRVGKKLEPGGPLRVGIFATPTSDRVRSGASYWGILDLSGNVAERVISVGSAAGRGFAGTHGDGGGVVTWNEAGFGIRGGGYPHGAKGIWDSRTRFHTSDRFAAAVPHHDARPYAQGFRCVRTAPERRPE